MQPLELLDEEEVIFSHRGVPEEEEETPDTQTGSSEQEIELGAGQQIAAPLPRHCIQPPD